jgi:hypothetical protein
VVHRQPAAQRHPFLHRLLACDPKLRSAPLRELMNPLPLGDMEAQPDPRIALAEQLLE